MSQIGGEGIQHHYASVSVRSKFILVVHYVNIFTTGVARNFDWEVPRIEKSCDVSLVTFWCRDNDGVTEMTS